MRKLKNAFKTVKIKASSFAQGEDLAKLENLFMVLEVKKTEAVEAFRSAQIAASLHAIKQAERMQAELAVLALAASFNNTIARESRWMIFKDADGGEITFEGLTEKLLRNNFRAQQGAVGRQVESEDFGDSMFEDADESEED